MPWPDSQSLRASEYCPRKEKGQGRQQAEVTRMLARIDTVLNFW